MGDAKYREFDNGEYSRLRRELLRKKGGSQQEEFLVSVREEDEFIEFMERLPLTSGEDIELCPHPLTETEFRNPPVDTQQRLHERWSAITPRVGCRSSFWGNVTYNHIRQGRIRAAYLAADGKHKGGAQRIDRALRETSDKRSTMMDDCVRTVLRRIGGLPEIRGNRTVYVDCPLARAWWRERFTVQVGQDDPSLQAAVRDVLRLNKEYWSILVSMIVSRNSVMGSQKIRDAFVIRLAEVIGSGVTGAITTAKGLKRGLRNLSALQAVRELSILDGGELDAIVEEILSSI